MTVYHREALVDVDVTINDRDVIDRCVNNSESQRGDGSMVGWRDQFYNLDTEEKVIDHLVYNAVRNGVERVNRLDGWADLPDDAATMLIIDVDPL